MPPSIARELALERHVLALAASDMASTALDAGGDHLTIAVDGAHSLRSRCAEDAAAYADWQGFSARVAAALHPVLNATPPRLGTAAWRDRATLLNVGWRLRRLGRSDLRELLRIGGMCVHDLLEDRFRLPLLKGALALDAVLGTNHGPRSPGTVLSLLYRAAAAPGTASFVQPAGGLGALSQALARAAIVAGAEVRTGSVVERILVSDDRAAGVRLASGETIAADTVISSADPKTTFLHLLGCEYLDAGFVRRVSQLRSRGLTAKLHLALARLPEFPGLDAAALGGRLLIAPSADYIERAYNHAKYEEFSTAPTLEVTVPTLADASLAPAGRHVLSAIVQYAPYSIGGGWLGQRQRFTDIVVETLARYAPGLPDCIMDSELLTPPDIEREFRISGGHWHHAELALDQFFMLRPVPGATQYRAPLAGLFLCGAGCHPGGGVMGLAGRNAARALIREAA